MVLINKRFDPFYLLLVVTVCLSGHRICLASLFTSYLELELKAFGTNVIY